MIINENSEAWECFSRNISWLRKHFKIPKKEMCKILQIDISTLKKIEKGKLPDEVTIEILFNAEKYFDIPIKVLISHFIYE